MEVKGLDQILYEGYCEKAGWKSVITGAPLPQWADCSKDVKDCWWAAAEAAIEWAYTRDNGPLGAGTTEELRMKIDSVPIDEFRP